MQHTERITITAVVVDLRGSELTVQIGMIERERVRERERERERERARERERRGRGERE